MKFHKDKGKCLRCGKKLTNSKSQKMLVGPECAETHWTQAGTTKASVMLEPERSLNPPSDWKERIKQIQHYADETESEIVYECYAYGVEHGGLFGFHPDQERCFAGATIYMWVKCSNFISSVTEYLEKELRETVTPKTEMVCVGAQRLGKKIDIGFYLIRVKEGEEAFFVWPDAPMPSSTIVSCQLLDVNAKSIAYGEEAFTNMGTWELVYADSAHNIVNPDGSMDISDKGIRNEPDSLDGIYLEIYNEYEESYIGDLWDDYEIPYIGASYKDAEEGREVLIEKIFGSQSNGLCYTIAEAIQENWYQWHGMAQHWDHWENFIHHVFSAGVSVAEQMFLQIGSISSIFMIDMPQKPKIELTNPFQGHFEWREMDSWGHGWYESEFDRGYAAFTNAEAADLRVPYRKDWD